MRAFILILVLGVLAGCRSYTHIRDGRPDFAYRCDIGGFNCTVEENHQVYPTAQAKYGQMPGNLQDGFAVEEAVAVHQRTMNSQLYGWGSWGLAGGLYPPEIYYQNHRMIRPYNHHPPAMRYIYVPPMMTMPVGPY